MNAPRRRRDALIIALPIVVTVIAFVFAYLHVEPPPPREITIAAGVAGRGYERAAQRLRDGLADEGITVTIRNTAGSSENVALLSAGEVDIAFVQSGVGDPREHDALSTLGGLYLEPLWVFHRSETPLADLRDVEGRRVILGAKGSGTRAIAEALLEDVGVAKDRIEPIDVSAGGESDALASGTADVAFLVAPPTSAEVHRLLTAKGVELLSFRRAEAYSRRIRSLQRVTVAEGLLDLDLNLPPSDVELLAPAATLVVTEEFHPALIDLVLMQARRSFGDRGLIQDRGDFPAPSALTFPLNEQARNFYRRGPSFLHGFLPFWAANTIERLLILLLPFLTLLIPLARVIPPLYQWRIRRRIKRWYSHLRALEQQFDRKEIDGETAARELAKLIRDVNEIEVPTSYGDELYQLRLHLRFVGDRFAAAVSSEEG